MDDKKMNAERAAFEAWYLREIADGQESLIKYPNGHYINDTTMDAWHGWQARASLPVGVPDRFRVMKPTGAVMRDGDRWEIYAPCGSGGIVHEDDVTDWVVRRLLDAMTAAPTVKAEQVQAMPQEWWQIIHDTLRNYRMSTLDDSHGGGYPLIDAMTADGQTVAGGIEECTYLADAIWNALPAKPPSLPAAGSDVE